MIAIVAGTRTKSGSTNFLRLHVLGEHKEGVRFLASTHEEAVPVLDESQDANKVKVKRVAVKPARDGVKRK